MKDSPVDAIYRDSSTLTELLAKSGEVSLSSSADDSYRKVMLLAAASYFEHHVIRIVLDFAAERSNADTQVLALVRAKAVERQYHTYFDWNKKNANKFFRLFGPRFSDHMQDVVKADEQLKAAISAFLELGSLRNQLVHQNFGSFSLDKTAEEIYELYKRASEFIDCLPIRLRDLPSYSEDDPTI